ncbi:uncharacterized protein CANTADRAFT_52660 [Suhomyces tanzawaensis NRRL Y-17324]|uniref:Tubulin-folding cofactor D ARM repeats domain-containing protein n=1 Tax=Suhomyces tanzawaensis NRRL Y-17324 TaxID=984487 RepID=A0A1E4SG73_9ASCO|nr:uncharacterized protein CANTADRAFT_52660 [Suhomyces tanzawaensis NRRL Y-17324]ODV78465.1 hypothetical protein CANTADRAFT_52660 [Suhomyces tanzawaensis NRRL Y-17324]
MDELQEFNVVKNERQLHDELGKLICDFGLLIKSDTSDRDKYEHSKSILNRIILGINEFEPSPKLLDSHLSFYIGSLTDLYFFINNQKKLADPIPYHYSGSFSHNIGEIIYNFSKIRGFKHVTNYFSSDVYLIPRLIELTKLLDNDNELFLCLIWLSNLVLVPFKLEHIESTLPVQLIGIAIENLSKHANASKNQLISLILLSRLLTRSDVIHNSNHLYEYFHIYVEPEWKSLDRLNGSVKLGHLITINKLLKRCPIEVIEPYLDTVYNLISIDLMNLRIQQESTQKHLNNLNVLYMIKILSKLSMVYVKRGNYQMTSTIINHLLSHIMNLMTTFDTSLRYAMAKSLAKLTKILSMTATNYQEQLISYMIGQLDLNLKPASSFVSCLIIDNDAVFIPKYHTILLYFGFTALENSFPVSLVPSLLSIIHKTLFMEQRRLSSVLGSQVRDSSCFVLWALCRIIKQDDFNALSMANPLMMETILFDLILIVIMDGELIIRRCGIAVIQEFVGRFGNLLFKQYIDDVFKVGEFIINFIELFASSNISSHQSSYLLIDEMIKLGFNKSLFIPKLLENVTNENLKFAIRKLSCTYLNLIMRMEGNFLNYEVKDHEEYGLEYILEKLLNLDIYFICVFLPDIDERSRSKYIGYLTERTLDFKFDYHHDTHEKAEGYLKWTNLQIKLGMSIENNWPIIFNILRLSPTPYLIEELIELFGHLDSSQLSQESIRKFQYYLRNNNQMLANVIFAYCFEDEEFEEFVGIMSASEVDCEIRTLMVNSLTHQQRKLPPGVGSQLVGLLDDYTLTKQGDVGSKIRYGVIQLIKHNFDQFYGLEKQIELKLVRLAGELIDKIRLEAMNLLLSMKGMSLLSNELSVSQYFAYLFKYYGEQILPLCEQDHEKQMSLLFWKGVTFSIGALAANATVLNESFAQLLVFLLDHSHPVVYQNFLTLLKVPQGVEVSARDQKSYVVVLNVFVKLFEANFQFPADFNYEALYIRCYNLQINTTNLTRIGLTLKIFHHMGELRDEVSVKCRKRIVALACGHKLGKVREMAGETMFEVINDLCPTSEAVGLLDTIEWGQSPLKLKQFKAKLEQILISI